MNYTVVHEECDNNQCKQLLFCVDFLAFPVNIESAAWEAGLEAIK